MPEAVNITGMRCFHLIDYLDRQTVESTRNDDIIRSTKVTADRQTEVGK